MPHSSIGDQLKSSVLSRYHPFSVLTIWGGRLVDGRGVVQERGLLQVEGDHIAKVGPAEGSSPPAGAVDIRGRTVIPGLIDAHVHLSGDAIRHEGFGPRAVLKGEPPRPRELNYFLLAKSAQAFLENGITSVRDVGSYHDEALHLRDAINLGMLEGPRILSCGRIVSATAPGGRIFGTMYCEADGPEGMRKAVREQIRRGADFIKIMATGARSVVDEDPEPAQVTRDELSAVVEETHRMGKRLAAHAEGIGGVRLAVEEGVDTIEHGLSLHREPALLDRMAERGIVLVPTLTTFHDLAERFTGNFAPRLVEQAKRQLEEAYRTLQAAIHAGVTLAMGHDSGPPGDDAIELVRMVEGGLTPQQSLAAATAGSAMALGLADVGHLRDGQRADLLVVDGDPLADIRLLRDRNNLFLVVHDGKPVAGRALAPVGIG
jgi:imidazolonepropionase-like amidohydrolase